MSVLSRPSKPATMTPFTKKVMDLVRQIPRGRVATYSQIAALAGKPHAARGVGWILNSCAQPYQLPWQRVINSKGKISFPTWTEEYHRQKKLLLAEKVRFLEDDSISMERYAWKKKARVPTLFRLSAKRP